MTIVMYIVQPLDIIIRGGVDLYHWYYGGETEEQIAARRPPIWVEFETFRRDVHAEVTARTEASEAERRPD